MIRFIKGNYIIYDQGSIIVETASGIGFRIHVSDTSSLLSNKEGDEISVYTFMHVKDDGMSLYGFAEYDELQLFEQLITVNGVGPKAGLAIMSLGTANQIKTIISSKDAASISQAQGIGKKTAERVILELSDKIVALPYDDSTGKFTVAPSVTPERSEAIIALTTLGYSKKEAEKAISSVVEENIPVEEYIKKALKYLI